MGKIFTALERYRKERAGKVSGRLTNSDYDLLLRFDENTGRLETDDPSAVGNSGSLKRLMTYRLIDAGGRLTPAGRAKHQELRRETKDRKPLRPLVPLQNNRRRKRHGFRNLINCPLRIWRFS